MWVLLMYKWKRIVVYFFVRLKCLVSSRTHYNHAYLHFSQFCLFFCFAFVFSFHSPQFPLCIVFTGKIKKCFCCFCCYHQRCVPILSSHMYIALHRSNAHFSFHHKQKIFVNASHHRCRHTTINPKSEKKIVFHTYFVCALAKCAFKFLKYAFWKSTKKSSKKQKEKQQRMWTNASKNLCNTDKTKHSHNI